MRSQKHSADDRGPQVLLKDSESGFSLMEIMVAIPIMAIVSLGTLSLFTYAMRYNAGGNSRALAIGVAQQQLEELRSVAFTDSSLTATTDTKTTVVAERHQFTVDKTITDNSDGSKTVTIKVTPYGGYDPTRATPSAPEQTTRASFSVTVKRAPITTGSYYSVP